MPLVLLLILQALLFGGLVVVLRSILRRNVSSATEHLTNLSQDYQRKEEELVARIEEAERNYDESIKRASAEAAELKERAEDDARQTAEKLLQQTQDEAEVIMTKALATAESLKQELDNEAENRALERACDLVEAALPEELRLPAHRSWTAELLKNGFSRLDEMRLEEGVNKVLVRTAFALEDKELKALEAKLKEKMGPDVQIKQEVDSSAVAGFCLQIGSLVMDGTLSHRLRETASHAKRVTE
ncbi:MAG: F0F1 ATP synthase subunit delta [Candidatus Omnitrophica bacterium]|nr:F0F1 ATP synthase subunit delta [Candidatus Omnitrophota bacterium]